MPNDTIKLNEMSSEDLIKYATDDLNSAIDRVYEAQRKILIYANRTGRSNNPIVCINSGFAYALDKQCYSVLHTLKSMYNQTKQLNNP